MIVRLQRFYGGDPMSWLRMPMWCLMTYWLQLPRMQAESNLNTVNTTLIGTGNMKTDAARSIIRRWSDLAEIKQAVRKLSEEDKVLEMQNIGIQVG